MHANQCRCEAELGGGGGKEGSLKPTLTMSSAVPPIFSFLFLLNLATTTWTFKSELDILDDCQWFSSVPSERRMKQLLEELRAADSYAASLARDVESLRQFSHLDPKTFELLKRVCGRGPLRAQVEDQASRINPQVIGDVAVSRLFKQRRGPNGYEFLNDLRKRKPAKSAPTELDPTFMLMGIGKK